MLNIRNRIKSHRRIRAGELVPHEMNPRIHGVTQRHTLTALYEEIGFARSLLAFELPDGRLKLIDGHLRRDLTPDMEVDVEILDLTEEEARVLLLSLDPLVALADYDQQILQKLQDITTTDNVQLQELWNSLHRESERVHDDLEQIQKDAQENLPEQFLILVDCEDEERQVQLLERFQSEGLKCRAMVN